jgi:tRNA U38,U39,U40 pseudouridine synthase TruA
MVLSCQPIGLAGIATVKKQNALTDIGTINTSSALDIELLAEASRAGRLDQGINAHPQVISLDQSTAEPVLLHRRIESSNACQN